MTKFTKEQTLQMKGAKIAARESKRAIRKQERTELNAILATKPPVATSRPFCWGASKKYIKRKREAVKK